MSPFEQGKPDKATAAKLTGGQRECRTLQGNHSPLLNYINDRGNASYITATAWSHQQVQINAAIDDTSQMASAALQRLLILWNLWRKYDVLSKEQGQADITGSYWWHDRTECERSVCRSSYTGVDLFYSIVVYVLLRCSMHMSVMNNGCLWGSTG